MITNEQQVAPTQPSLIAALMGGFDTITNHLELVLFPLVLDLFLWFGPHLRLKMLVQQIVNQMTALPGMDSPDIAPTLAMSKDLWLLVAERFNLFSVLRSYPVGIPSLMGTRQSLTTPLLQPLILEVPSVASAIGLWLLLTIAGLIVGAFYFTLVAQATLNGKVEWRSVINEWPWTSLQVLYLTLFLASLMIAISIPGSCLITAATFSGLPVAQFGFLLFGALALWLLFPLFLSAHGIFAYHYRMWISVRASARLIRLMMPRTSLLFLAILVISEGLDTLWRVPAENSWLSLVGVIGHAFVSTSLLAASFVYYRDATRWVQRLIQQSLLVDGKNLREKIT
jgi:hypothetical protein